MKPTLCAHRKTLIRILLPAGFLLSACQSVIAPIPEIASTIVTPPASGLPAASPQSAASRDKSAPSPLLNPQNTPYPLPAEDLQRIAPDRQESPVYTPSIISNQGHTQKEESALTLLPDSEVVYSPSALDFDTAHYLAQTNGFLSEYREYLHSTGWTSAADIVQRVALERSINPRLLLALVEYQTGSVRGQPGPGFNIDYLAGSLDYHHKGFYRQLSWVASLLSVGYYGWRDGTLK